MPNYPSPFLLCRRSQRGRAIWDRLTPIFERWIPAPRVLHPYPLERFVATQVAHFAHARPVLALLWPEMKMTPAQRELVTEHITEFSLAYLHAKALVGSQ